MKRSIFAVAVAFLLAPPGFAAESRMCAAGPSDSLLSALVKQAPGLRSGVLRLALDAMGCAEERGLV